MFALVRRELLLSVILLSLAFFVACSADRAIVGEDEKSVVLEEQADSSRSEEMRPREEPAAGARSNEEPATRTTATPTPSATNLKTGTRNPTREEDAVTATPTAAQLTSPTSTPVVTELKQELYLARGGGGGIFTPEPPCLNLIPASNEILPAIRNDDEHFFFDSGQFCLFGLPLNEEFELEMHPPQGEYVSRGTFSIRGSEVILHHPTRGEQVSGQLVRHTDPTILTVSLNLPPGSPVGEWEVVGEAGSERFSTLLEVPEQTWNRIEARPDTDWDVFVDYWYREFLFEAGSPIYIVGEDFPPNERLPLGIYFARDGNLSGTASLVQGRYVIADEDGYFSALFELSPPTTPGWYQAVVVTNYEEGDEFRNVGPETWFDIASPLDTVTSSCNNKAEFVADMTVPDDTRVRAGEEFVKTWRLRNTGSCTWTESYLLAYLRDELMGATSTSARLPHEVPPGETVDISVRFTAPSSPGKHVSVWQMVTADGERFGIEPYVRVIVEQ